LKPEIFVKRGMVKHQQRSAPLTAPQVKAAPQRAQALSSTAGEAERAAGGTDSLGMDTGG